MNSELEILAPAGSSVVANAAIEAGANAIYLGLKQFNARRGADNFSPESFKEIVKKAHDKNVKVHLTLNIDLTQRELQQAIRAVQLAVDAHADAIIIRDPALLKLIPIFPQIDFHFSTQAAISSTAGMLMAKKLGLKRVVLPRELNQEEIEACCHIKEIETEVFVQGALCFSISGRCFLSSWVGGRSGNRGTCASPCRVGYSVDSETKDEKCHPFSMHDLSLIEHIQSLKKMGVNSLKIEGRLKSASWVKNVITLYKDALALGKGKIESQLGAYTGRMQTDGFFVNSLKNLTAESAGREKESTTTSETLSSNAPTSIVTFEIGEGESTPIQCLMIHVYEDDKKGINFKLNYGEREDICRIPSRPIKKIEKAIPLSMQCESMQELASENFSDIEIKIECDNELLLMPTQFNQLDKQFSTFMRLCLKPEDTTLRYPISDELKSVFQINLTQPSKNTKFLGTKWESARLAQKDVESFSKAYPHAKIKVDIIDVTSYQSMSNILPSNKLIIALPPVFYEKEMAGIEAMLKLAVQNGNLVEVNSWDGLFLAQKYNCRFEAGYGMGILNGIAAEMLYAQGCERVAISIEADVEQIIHICEATFVPLSLTTYGRMPLFMTRVPPKCDASFTDSRGYELMMENKGHFTIYRSLKPFNISDKMSRRILVNRIDIDLLGSENPIEEVKKYGQFNQGDMRFNYERSLK